MLRGLVLFVAVVVCLGGVLSALFELRAQSGWDGLQAMTLDLSAGAVRAVSRESMLREALAAAKDPAALPQTQILAARLFKTAGDQAKTPELKIDFYCKTLSLLGSAVQQRPFDAQYLMNWANMRQILAGVSCSQDLTSGNFEEAAETALLRHPADAELQYRAALLSLWAGNKTRALELFSRVLLLATDLTELQREYIRQQIDNESDLLTVVPARFPQVNQWAALFLAKDPERFSVFASGFKDLQVKALKKGLQDYRQGEIPPEIFFRHLSGLMATAADAEMGQRADTEMATYFEEIGSEEGQRYFEERSKIRKLDVARAWRAADTRPASTCLAGWGRKDRVAFDSYYTTLGFYLPPGRRVKMIELHALQDIKALEPQFLRIYVSDDNERWRELGERIEVERISFAGGVLMALKIKGSYFKYWKVHFGGAQRNQGFVNTLPQIINVYG
ncbi:MAG: hypothetical protein GX589_01670 [Deltaproteobacteria bacterium]|nr:hypothetical protein [Deltaproteobacteria bacterium]